MFFFFLLDLLQSEHSRKAAYEYNLYSSVQFKVDAL